MSVASDAVSVAVESVPDDSQSTCDPHEDFKPSELEKTTETEDVPWSTAHEVLLKRWGEHAAVYRLLHSRSHEKYKKYSTFTQIPIIVLSTVVGTLSIGSQSLFPPDKLTEANVAVGILSLISSVLGTLSSYLRLAERSEGHRQSEIQYSKLSRHIAAELAMSRENRLPCRSFLKTCRRDFDQLLESAPLIDSGILMQYKRSVGKKALTEVHQPELVVGPRPIEVYVQSVEDRDPNDRSGRASAAESPVPPDPESRPVILPLPNLSVV